MFVPDQGPSAGRTFFVERPVFGCKSFPHDLRRPLQEPSASAFEKTECDRFGFTLAGNAALDPGAIQRPAERGIRSSGPVERADTLAETISAWASERGSAASRERAQE